MNHQKLSVHNTKELKKKLTALQVITWMLAIAILGSLVFYIVISIQNGFTPLLILPISLSIIVIVNVRSIRIIKQEINARNK